VTEPVVDPAMPGSGRAPLDARTVRAQRRPTEGTPLRGPAIAGAAQRGQGGAQGDRPTLAAREATPGIGATPWVSGDGGGDGPPARGPARGPQDGRAPGREPGAAWEALAGRAPGGGDTDAAGRDGAAVDAPEVADGGVPARAGEADPADPGRPRAGRAVVQRAPALSQIRSLPGLGRTSP
jgi:hypothetical protein